MKIIFLAMCIFICGLLRAQINIINQSLAINSPDILYLNVENHLLLKVPARSSYQLTIEGAGNSIRKESDTTYSVSVQRIEPCKVIVSKNGKAVFTKNYSIAPIADVCGSLAGSYNTSVSKNKILLNPFLKVIHPGSFYNDPRHIISFSILIPQDMDSTLIAASEYTLSKEQLKLISQLDHGTTIYFKRVWVSCPSGRITSVPDFWIKLE